VTLFTRLPRLWTQSLWVDTITWGCLASDHNNDYGKCSKLIDQLLSTSSAPSQALSMGSNCLMSIGSGWLQRTVTHNFNENCLTIFIFYSKLKSDQCSSISIVFKVWNQNLLMFSQFLSDFNDLCTILTRIVWQIWTCFQNQIPTFVARMATILVCSKKKLSKMDDLSFTFYFMGGLIFTAFFMTVHKKALYQRPWQIWPRPWG